MAKFGRVVLGGRVWESGRSIVVEARGVLRYGRILPRGEFNGVEPLIDKLIASERDTFRIGTHRAKWVS